MKLILNIFTLCIICISVSAQEAARVLILPAPDQIFIYGWSRENYEVRDTSEISLTYQMDYLNDVSARQYRTNRMILQIGDSWGRYYSLARDVGDIKGDRIGRQHRTLGMPGNLASVKDEEEMLQIAGDQNMNGEIWSDYVNQKLKDRYHSLHKYNESLEYEEPLPPFDWVTQSDTMTICGYPCWRAETTFRGRKWIAWYTPNIPVNAGPWKFNGLPGLILKIEDSKEQYSWKCIGIKQDKEPILYFNADVISSTRKKCLQYFRNIHEQPMMTFRGRATSLRVLSQGKWLDDSWSIPYNPIELE